LSSLQHFAQRPDSGATLEKWLLMRKRECHRRPRRPRRTSSASRRTLAANVRCSTSAQCALASRIRSTVRPFQAGPSNAGVPPLAFARSAVTSQHRRAARCLRAPCLRRPHDGLRPRCCGLHCPLPGACRSPRAPAHGLHRRPCAKASGSGQPPEQIPCFRGNSTTAGQRPPACLNSTAQHGLRTTPSSTTTRRKATNATCLPRHGTERSYSLRPTLTLGQHPHERWWACTALYSRGRVSLRRRQPQRAPRGPRPCWRTHRSAATCASGASQPGGARPPPPPPRR